MGYFISRGLAKSGAREPYSVSTGHDGGITHRLTKAATVLREGDLPQSGHGVGTEDPGRPLSR